MEPSLISVVVSAGKELLSSGGTTGALLVLSLALNYLLYRDNKQLSEKRVTESHEMIKAIESHTQVVSALVSMVRLQKEA